MKRSTIALYLLYIAVALIGAAIIWYIVLYILRWDVVLTPHQKFLLYWKPAILMLLGMLALLGGKKLIS